MDNERKAAVPGTVGAVVGLEFRASARGTATVVYVDRSISHHAATRTALARNARRQWRVGLSIGGGRVVTRVTTHKWPMVMFSWANSPSTSAPEGWRGGRESAGATTRIASGRATGRKP